MGYCKICFSEINKKGINGILCKNTICQNCYNKFPVSFNQIFINISPLDFKQPQLLVLPYRKLEASTITSPPQSHLHL